MAELGPPPSDITKVDVAFPARATEWAPAEEDIPKEFWDGNEWTEIVESWFRNGLPKGVEFYPYEGIVAEDAFKAVQTTIGCFAFSHEYKVAAAGYMLASWFGRIDNWQFKPEEERWRTR
jgi:hypothetical protein